MQAVTSTPLALVIFVWVVFRGPRVGVIVLFATLPLGATAAFLVPGLGSVTLTDFGLLTLWVSMIGRVRFQHLATAALPPSPGFALLALLCLTTLGTVFLPQVFHHQSEVFAIVPGETHAVISLVQIEKSGSNTTQLMRFWLGALSFFAVHAVIFDRADRRGTDGLMIKSIAAATGVHLLVSLVDWIGAPLGMAVVLSPLRTLAQAILVDQQFSGLRRLIGGFTEPASFGLFTMGLYGIWLRLSLSAKHYAYSGVVTLSLALLAVRSTSSATIANLGVFTAMALLWWLLKPGKGTRVGMTGFLGLGFVPVALGATVYFYARSGMFADLLNTVIFDKSVSISGQERLMWNIQALANLRDSFGLGLGIGSVRASSWAAAVLGNIGLPGALCFGWFLHGCFRKSEKPTLQGAELGSALRWGCAAVLMQSLLTRPYPDLGVAFFAMAAMAVGLRTGGGARVNRLVEAR